MPEPVYRRGYRNLFGKGPAFRWRFVGTVPSAIVIPPVFISEGDANATLTSLEGDSSKPGSIEGGVLIGATGLEG